MSAVADIFALKQLLRTEVLAAAKAMCKKSPSWRAEQSRLLCTSLWESPAFAKVRDIESRYNEALNEMDDAEEEGEGGAPSPAVPVAAGRNMEKPFCVGLYLPLWFEADVEPLLHRLLAVRELPQVIIQQHMEQIAASSAAATAATGASATARDSAIMRLPPAIRIFVPEVVDVVDGVSAVNEAPATAQQQRRREMDFVEVLSAADLYDNFVPAPPYNIREPPRRANDPLWQQRGRISRHNASGAAPEAPAAELDLLVVPGVAFDFAGNRLGKGAGFYDRWIVAGTAGAAAEASTLFVGVGFDEQLPKFSRRESKAVTQVQQRSFWDAVALREEKKAEDLMHTVPMVGGSDMPLDMVVTPSFSVLRK
jgi:5,10-methenyltetrahydrofolate synthetase